MGRGQGRSARISDGSPALADPLLQEGAASAARCLRIPPSQPALCTGAPTVVVDSVTRCSHVTRLLRGHDVSPLHLAFAVLRSLLGRGGACPIVAAGFDRNDVGQEEGPA